jgi:hypothetical protein
LSKLVLNHLNILVFVYFLVIQPVGPTSAQDVAEVRPPYVLTQTHLAPSPFTLLSGRVVMGSSVALGITDSIQISTDLLRDAYQIFNVGLKWSLFSNQRLAFALTFNFESYNLNILSDSNPDLQVQSWQPGAVIGLALNQSVAIFVYGKIDLKNSAPASAVKSSGFLHSTSGGVDLAWAYQKESLKTQHRSNSLTLGASHDFGYQVSGVGISHHWPGFHLGIHYYLNAKSNAVWPIISGGFLIGSP